MSKAYLCKCENHHIVIVEEKHMKKGIRCSRCDSLLYALEKIDASKVHEIQIDSGKCQRGGSQLNDVQIQVLDGIIKNNKELGMSICSCDVQRVLDMNNGFLIIITLISQYKINQMLTAY